MNAAYRQLTIFQSLMNGQLITKSELVAQFAVNPRVIQRDFSQLKQFIADQQLPYQLAYHRGLGGYQLTSQQDDLSLKQPIIFKKQERNRVKLCGKKSKFPDTLSCCFDPWHSFAAHLISVLLVLC